MSWVVCGCRAVGSDGLRALTYKQQGNGAYFVCLILVGNIT